MSVTAARRRGARLYSAASDTRCRYAGETSKAALRCHHEAVGPKPASGNALHLSSEATVALGVTDSGDSLPASVH